jgi:hypothetical protein
MRILSQPSPVNTIIDKNQPESVECFKYLCSILITDARFVREVKSSIVMEKATFNKMKNFR